jgi:hypothetical protein
MSSWRYREVFERLDYPHDLSHDFSERTVYIHSTSLCYYNQQRAITPSDYGVLVAESLTKDSLFAAIQQRLSGMSNIINLSGRPVQRSEKKPWVTQSPWCIRWWLDELLKIIWVPSRSKAARIHATRARRCGGLGGAGLLVYSSISVRVLLWYLDQVIIDIIYIPYNTTNPLPHFNHFNHFNQFIKMYIVWLRGISVPDWLFEVNQTIQSFEVGLIVGHPAGTKCCEPYLLHKQPSCYTTAKLS